MAESAYSLASITTTNSRSWMTYRTHPRLFVGLLLLTAVVAVALPARLFASEKTIRLTEASRELAKRSTAQPVASQVGATIDARPALVESSELLKPVTPAVSTQKARKIRMLVTAYCACKKCCGPNAQGITASGKRVTHNGGRFVAADRALFAFGAKLQIPGYHNGQTVEVLDRGGAIKGKHLDVFFPSHQKALEWGKRYVDVTVIGH